MKSYKLLLSIIALGLLQACASPTYEYRPDTVQVSEPPIDSINTAYVCDALLTQGTFTEHDAIFLDSKVKVGIIGNYTFSRGYYSKTGGDSEKGFYLPSKSREGGSVTKGLMTDPFKIIEAQYRPKTLCGVSVSLT